MSKRARIQNIRLRGVRHNNLKNFDLDLPLRHLIVVTGPSGSGKSSLAFDTLFAEGQRRYIETFSPYARQFFDRMDKPQVDRIEGIPPAIAIEQRNTVKTTRSTVGTMTEICEHMKALWVHIAQLHCRRCGRAVRKDSPQSIWETLCNPEPGSRSSGSGHLTNSSGEVVITFDLPLSEKLSLEETLGLTSKQGYQRLLLEGRMVRLDEAIERLRDLKPIYLRVIQDRVQVDPASRARFVEACEQAYHFGKGKLAVSGLAHAFSPEQPVCEPPSLFSNRFHCAACDLEYREPTASLFSFNNPVGACRSCRGFGRTITIDYNLAIPDRSKTLAGGAVKPWQTGHGMECQEDLLKFCNIRGVPIDVAFERLANHWQDWVIQGEPDYGKDSRHEWPHAWYGIKGYFRWLESKAYKMHVRVLLSRYRSYRLCPDCQGKRFQPDSLLFKVRDETGFPSPHSETRACTARIGRNRRREVASFPVSVRTNQQQSPHFRQVELLHDRISPTEKDQVHLRTQDSAADLTLADFYQLPIRDALAFIKRLSHRRKTSSLDPVRIVLHELESRLNYLMDVGLGYLTLDRPMRSLSGGETERVNLTTCLGTRLVNTLFVLDEPSVGLHPRDINRLIRTLERLRDAGNTVVVVEHESNVIRAADQIVDLGPGQGEQGGRVIFQGTVSQLFKCSESLTGQYMSGKKQVPIPQRRPVFLGHDSGTASLQNGPVSKLVLAHAKLHNLKDLTIAIPLQRLVCITGVSGSGKTTLIREELLSLLQAKFKAQNPPLLDADGIEGAHSDPLGNQAPDFNSQLLIGWEKLGRVVLVDQSALGKTPRSNPAVYIGAFDDIREIFAETEGARQRGLKASAFSFNSREGQCERCRGAGFEKIEMQFLSDVYIRCPDCNGRRYRQHILEVRLSSDRTVQGPESKRATGLKTKLSISGWNIADLLEATVEEVIEFLGGVSDARAVRRALQSLRLLQEVGLGYLRLGQPINTLSGGESQRLKLVSYLAEFAQANSTEFRRTMFLFDEPTTGLHFDDVRILLQVFQRLVDAGHSVIVIEHNLDVIKSADWIIDLGPEAGDLGGEVVAEGTPEQVAACPASHTGRALKESGVL